MRIAVLILGLILGAVMFVQSVLIAGLSGIADDSDAAGGAAGGVAMALLWLVGCALVIPLPIVSAVSFGLAGLIGIAFAATGSFSDLRIWGVASLVLAVLSIFGWVGKRNDDRRRRLEAEERRRLSHQVAVLSQRVGPTVSPNEVAAPGTGDAPPRASGPDCPDCGVENPIGSRFCASCGTALAAATG